MTGFRLSLDGGNWRIVIVFARSDQGMAPLREGITPGEREIGKRTAETRRGLRPQPKATRQRGNKAQGQDTDELPCGENLRG